jgi:4-hydroxy-3-polyprenylbenzoate decarboxylase
MAERLAPGFVIDVTTFHGLTIWSGAVFQVKKRRRGDEGLQRNILGACMNAIRGIRLAIVVDEDVNIYSPEDLIWAMTTRVNPDTDIIRGVSARGHAFQPSERVAAGAGTGVTTPTSVFEGGIGIDATVPMVYKETFFRGHYAVDKVDLKKWFPEERIKAIKQGQTDYYRFLGETGLP